MPAAVSDTGRTLARLRFDIVGLFPLLTPPIREQYRSEAVIVYRRHGLSDAIASKMTCLPILHATISIAVARELHR